MITSTPFERDIATTSWPRSVSTSTTCRPTRPVAPATAILVMSHLLSGHGHDGSRRSGCDTAVPSRAARSSSSTTRPRRARRPGLRHAPGGGLIPVSLTTRRSPPARPRRWRSCGPAGPRRRIPPGRLVGLVAPERRDEERHSGGEGLQHRAVTAVRNHCRAARQHVGVPHPLPHRHVRRSGITAGFTAGPVVTSPRTCSRPSASAARCSRTSCRSPCC